MTSGNFLKRKEWEYSGGLSKHELNVTNVTIVLLVEWRDKWVTFGRTEVNNEMTLCFLKAGTVEKAKSVSDL